MEIFEGSPVFHPTLREAVNFRMLRYIQKLCKVFAILLEILQGRSSFVEIVR